MNDNISLKIIATIRTGFRSKFGIPRQSGLVSGSKAVIVFEPEYRNDEALRGLENFSHLWLVWKFSETVSEKWSPTVRPPKLGGNKRMGVFATRAPYRPNPIGLSSVKLDSIEYGTSDGTILHISGADLLDGTPIYDIKPYIAYSDSHPDAVCGFADEVYGNRLKVDFGGNDKDLPTEIKEQLEEILACDPRPGYQDDSERIYKFEYFSYAVSFKVENDTLTVLSIKHGV